MATLLNSQVGLSPKCPKPAQTDTFYLVPFISCLTVSLISLPVVSTFISKHTTCIEISVSQPSYGETQLRQS